MRARSWGALGESSHVRRRRWQAGDHGSRPSLHYTTMVHAWQQHRLVLPSQFTTAPLALTTQTCRPRPTCAGGGPAGRRGGWGVRRRERSAQHAGRSSAAGAPTVSCQERHTKEAPPQHHTHLQPGRRTAPSYLGQTIVSLTATTHISCC